jgi:hypothetical protein
MLCICSFDVYLQFLFAKFQLDSYSETIGNMSGRSQDKLGPERNTLGRSAEYPKVSEYWCVTGVYCYSE